MTEKLQLKQQAGGNAVGKFKLIPLGLIEPDPDNTRRDARRSDIKGLAASVSRHGVLQPILVREIKGAAENGAKYRIVAGERRFRAALAAGLAEIPAAVKSLDEAEALSVQLVENLQREEVHPLDEADGFLRMREEMRLDLRGIADRVGKDTRYVARRLALTKLIAEAREDFKKERITLAHALEICRLGPDIQPHALAACFETKSVFDEESQVYRQAPDRERPALHARYLTEWIRHHVHLNLSQAPFRLDDARLREDGLTCLSCPERSGFNRALFSDLKETDTCLNPPCFQGKLRAFLRLRKEELEAKAGRSVAFISSYYGTPAEGEALSRGDYHPVEKKADRCPSAERAIVADGPTVGQVEWVCRTPECPEHLGRVPEYRRHAGGDGSARPASAADRNVRKQELFDIKVDEEVRKRVMREAFKTYSWPLDRTHLNEVAKEFFGRVPSEHRRTIAEVLGWEREEAEKLHHNAEAVREKVAGFGDDELGRFLMLLSFAHLGANHHGHRRVDQTEVVRLSAERGVNHALIDAEVRLERCPKKYKAAHQSYLSAVKAGRPARLPAVHERAPQAAQQQPPATEAVRQAA
jgi:ParB/RepB/Spo0J family partition protein